MAVELTFKRTVNGLSPANEDSTEALKLWPLGATIKGEFRVARDNTRINWWWKLCEIVSDNSDYWPTKETASDSLKMGIGIVETYIEKDAARGVWIEKRKPGSIAFGNKAMTEDKFKAFCTRAQNYVCTDMLIGANVDDLVRELEAFLNPDSRKSADKPSRTAA